MNAKPHTNILSERLTQPVVYMTEAEIGAFQAMHNISPWIAALLNLLPGLGYFYCRSWKLGVAAMLVLPALYFKGSVWLCLFVSAWLPVDSYYCALAYNGRLLKAQRRRHNDW